jgi:hypothetical protein
MKHRAQLTLATTALALLATAPTAAAAPATIRLLEKRTFQHYTDKGAKGESPGDIRVFAGTLYNLHRHRIGSDRITCVVATQGSHCHGELVLAHGDIYAQALVTGPRFTAKIVGGTGAYAHARGTLSVTSGPLSSYTLRIGR